MSLNSRSVALFSKIVIVLVIISSTAVTELAQIPKSESSPTPSAQPTTNADQTGDSQKPDTQGDTSAKPQSDPTPSANPPSSPERRFIGNILRDQRDLFTAPLHLHESDVKYLVPFGLVTGGLIATDRRSANELIDEGGSPNRVRISNDISMIGSGYGVSGIAGTMYLIGRLTDNARLRETGLLGAEAFIDSGIVSTVIKTATQRMRPNSGNGRGAFFNGGASFPSGHATVSWALASVVAHEYKNSRLISFGAYGLAALVSVSRFTGRDHFLSDILVGSALGYTTGRFVYRHHHDPALDGSGNPPAGKATSLLGSRLFPSIAPSYSRVTSTYGLRLSWGL